MRKAIGFVIILIAIAHFMSEPFSSFKRATSETFNVVTAAAELSQMQLHELR